MMKKEELKLTQDWDKTFPKSDKVDHCKEAFVNRYGITLAAERMRSRLISWRTSLQNI